MPKERLCAQLPHVRSLEMSGPSSDAARGPSLTQLRHPDSADKPLSPEAVRVPDLGVWSRRVVALDDLISIWNLEQTLLVIADPMLLPVKLGFGLLYNPLRVNS